MQKRTSINISSYAEGGYKTGFCCNSCDEVKQGERWNCKLCLDTDGYGGYDYCFECVPKLGMPKTPATSPLEHRKDRLLEDLLVKYDVMSLYNTFASNSKTNDVIWDLKDEPLKDMGLTIGDILKYNKARDKAKVEEKEGGRRMVDGIMGLHPKNQVEADVDRPNIMEDNTDEDKEGANTLVENDSVHDMNTTGVSSSRGVNGSSSSRQFDARGRPQINPRQAKIQAEVLANGTSYSNFLLKQYFDYCNYNDD